MIKKLKKLGTLLVLITILSLVFSSLIFAQTTPEFLVSWKAINYVPADYQGKILPGGTTPIEIGFDLLDGNKIADLSRKEIGWFINSRAFASGVGLKKIKFPGNSKSQNIRITVFDYKGADLEKFIDIPSVRPEIILDSKVPGNSLGLRNYQFIARPFFFNISGLGELSFNWKVNDQSTAGAAANPEVLNLSLASPAQPAETDLTISVSARNIFNDLETAAEKINFKVR